jgi:hypothetical protein
LGKSQKNKELIIEPKHLQPKSLGLGSHSLQWTYSVVARGFSAGFRITPNKPNLAKGLN